MLDAYVLRSLVRRCNYDQNLMENAAVSLEIILMDRSCGTPQRQAFAFSNDMIDTLIERYKQSGMCDIRILDYVTHDDLEMMDTRYLKMLVRTVNQCLEHKPFPVITVHDNFEAHANNCNWVRMHYRNILAELADSTVLDDILSQLYGVQGHFPKKSQNLSQYIYKSNYSLS